MENFQLVSYLSAIILVAIGVVVLLLGLGCRLLAERAPNQNGQLNDVEPRRSNPN